MQKKDCAWRKCIEKSWIRYSYSSDTNNFDLHLFLFDCNFPQCFFFVTILACTWSKYVFYLCFTGIYLFAAFVSLAMAMWVELATRTTRIKWKRRILYGKCGKFPPKLCESENKQEKYINKTGNNFLYVISFKTRIEFKTTNLTYS